MASVRIKEDDVMKRQSRRDFLAATAAMAVSAVITGHARTSQSPSKSPGLPTTWGIPTAKDWIAEDDAVVIARLKACGFRQARHVHCVSHRDPSNGRRLWRRSYPPRLPSTGRRPDPAADEGAAIQAGTSLYNSMHNTMKRRTALPALRASARSIGRSLRRAPAALPPSSLKRPNWHCGVSMGEGST
jgi:hypothetical protein